MRRLFETLYPIQPAFTLADVLSTMAAHPDWLHINQHVEQKQALPDNPHPAEQTP